MKTSPDGEKRGTGRDFLSLRPARRLKTTTRIGCFFDKNFGPDEQDGQDAETTEQAGFYPVNPVNPVKKEFMLAAHCAAKSVVALRFMRWAAPCAKRLGGLLGLMAFMAFSASAQIQQAWVAHYNHGITNGTNQAVKMALDSGGEYLRYRLFAKRKYKPWLRYDQICPQRQPTLGISV